MSADGSGAVLRRAGRVGLRTARAASRGAARALGRVADPVPLAAWLVSGAADPSDAKRRATTRIAGITTPTPGDIVANYLLGSVLLGLPGRTDRRVEWRWDPQRGVIDAGSAHVSDRTRRYLRRAGFEIRFDHDFGGVVEASRREDWTWITDEVKSAYVPLFGLGLAASIGVYDDDGELVGGTWGPLVGRTFGAMSIFHSVDHAGSAALAAMTDAIGPDGRWDLVDVGLVKPSTARFGAHAIPVDEFTTRVLAGLAPPGDPAGTDRR